MTVQELQHLAAAMAHEVRNPLNSMAIHLELLEGRLRKEGARPEALRSLGVLSQEIDRIDQILERYLAYAGPLETTRASVDTSALLDRVVERVRPVAAARQVRLERQGSPRPWLVDAEALVEALAAVAERAVATSPAGAVVALAAREDEAAEQAEVTIRDRAAPLLAAEQAELFRLGAERGSVGLTVARQIIKGHGGSLAISPADGGNLFTIRFPLDAELD